MEESESKIIRFIIPQRKILIIKFPEELTKNELENLKEDFLIDFPSSIIYEIKQYESEKALIENENKKTMICVIVPDNDLNGVKEFFFGYIIEDKYNLYIEE